MIFVSFNLFFHFLPHTIYIQVLDYQIDATICSESKIRSLNREYRDISKSTDILSFPVNEVKF
jgi:ssRNA-specific RNase YbeY (16S rRNA maturation enzyme)